MIKNKIWIESHATHILWTSLSTFFLKCPHKCFFRNMSNTAPERLFALQTLWSELHNYAPNLDFYKQQSFFGLTNIEWFKSM